MIAMLGDNKTHAILISESKAIDKCGGLAAVKSDLKGEGDVRFGSTEITFKGQCPAKKQDAQLVKEDGTWKVKERIR